MCRFIHTLDGVEVASDRGDLLGRGRSRQLAAEAAEDGEGIPRHYFPDELAAGLDLAVHSLRQRVEIGRASCRERV